MTQTSSILIIEDNEIDRELFRNYLSSDAHNNYEIFEVDTALEGLELCERIQFDLILLDFRLPDMNGLEFLAEQRQRQFDMPASAVIVITGVGHEALVVKMLHAGAANYLSKYELQAEEFLRVVCYTLRQRQLQISRSSSIFTELAAASILRFRRTLELPTIAESAAVEIRYLTRCDRASIFQSSGVAEPLLLAQAQTLDFARYLKQQEAMRLRRRRRGRPPKNRPTDLNVITSEEFSIKFRNARLPWGWITLDYLPDAPQLTEDEKPAFQKLVEQLAIAIEHAEQYSQAFHSARELEMLRTPEDKVLSKTIIQARQILSNLLLTTSTLSQHRKQFSELRQDQLLHQAKLYSQEFVQLLENTFSSSD